MSAEFRTCSLSQSSHLERFRRPSKHKDGVDAKLMRFEKLERGKVLLRELFSDADIFAICQQLHFSQEQQRARERAREGVIYKRE